MAERDGRRFPDEEMMARGVYGELDNVRALAHSCCAQCARFRRTPASTRRQRTTPAHRWWTRTVRASCRPTSPATTATFAARAATRWRAPPGRSCSARGTWSAGRSPRRTTRITTTAPSRPTTATTAASTPAWARRRTASPPPTPTRTRVARSRTRRRPCSTCSRRCTAAPSAAARRPSRSRSASARSRSAAHRSPTTASRPSVATTDERALSIPDSVLSRAKPLRLGGSSLINVVIPRLVFLLHSDESVCQ